MANGMNEDAQADDRLHAAVVGERGVVVPEMAAPEMLAPEVAAQAEPRSQGRRTYRLDLEYDGTAFGGWAKQPGCRTVQATLEGALETFLRRAVPLSVAGRTDAGVHASAQVASFEADVPIDLLRLRLGLNALLPPDMAVRAVTPASDGFDARAATARTYRYRLWLAPVRPVLERAFVWHLHRPVDTAVLPLAASLFAVRRDWSALTPSAHEYHHCEREISEAHWSRVTVHGTERRLEPMTVQSGPIACGTPAAAAAEWVFEVTAASFLHNMVRVMVGSMVDAALGRLTMDDLRRGIESGERRNMGQTAPARGLCLVAVCY
jgi:tRNA pseudouridine38-40 synthase